MTRAKKYLGQHFLHDPHVIERIVESINLLKDDVVLEIGPGQGALTTSLLPRLSELTVVEFDKEVIPILESRCASLGKLNIVHQDILKFDLLNFAKQYRAPIRLIGNLPYNISSPLLFHCLKHVEVIKDMHFMVQREVGERLAAKPGSKIYGRLSVMIQYHCEASLLFHVSPGAFHPPPKVNSSVIRLIPKSTRSESAKDPAIFAQVVALAFQQRRKTLRNSLSALLNAEQIKECGIDPQARAETLSVEDYVRLANRIS